MKTAIKFWLDLGVDGVRVDAVDWMAKDPQFRDNPVNPHYSPGVDDPYHEFDRIYSQKAPQLYDYLREMATVVKSTPHGFMVTETYPDRRNIVSEYLKLYDRYLAEVSAPFNFEGILLPWVARSFKTFIDNFQAGLKPRHVPIYVLGNHDNSRLATRIGPAAARTAAMMLLTLPGIAFIYYGEEIGMTDVPIPPDRVQDPFEKRVPGLGLGRDPERTPMQWTSGKHAGFSKVEPWLPVSSHHTLVNVEAQAHDRASILTLYRKLIQLRNFSPILQHGSYIPLELNNAYVFGFVRRYEDNELAVVLNFSEHPVEFHSRLGKGALMYSTQGDTEGLPIDLSHHKLRPNEGQIVTLF
jgi:alpha-glucosidase